MPIATVDGVDIYYELHGKGPPLMMVAGLGGKGSYWQPQLEAFSKNYTVILHDHRGTGRSACPETYTVDLMAADAVGLMDHLGVAAAHYVGHSTGGAIGQVIAAEHPGRLASMVQYASWPKTDEHFNWCFQVRLNLLDHAGMVAFTHGSTPFMMPPDHIQNNAARLLETLEERAADWPPPDIARKRIEAILAFDRLDDLERMNVPTLVAVARDDQLTPPYHSQIMADRIPGARLHVFDYGGHACSIIRPDEFNIAVLDFLDGRQAQEPLEAMR